MDGDGWVRWRYLFVDAEDPALDVGVVAVRYVVDGEHRSVLDRSATVGPETRVSLHQWVNINSVSLVLVALWLFQ